MRYLMLLALAVVLFSAANLFAGVDIPEPQMTYASPATVAGLCGGHSSVGCTTFRQVWLTCRCDVGADGWSVKAAIRGVPLTYVTNVTFVRHEKLHIGDFRYYLGKHVEALESQSFSSFATCDRFATLAMNTFYRTFQSVARISAALRDQRSAGTSEDHLIVVKAKIVTELMDDGLADLTNDFTAAVGHAENRTAKNRDLIGQRR